MASGYGYKSFGSLMCDRQTLQFVATARAIRECHAELLQAGCSDDYARFLASFAAATLVRRIRRATRGCKILAHGDQAGTKQNRVQAADLFSSEASLIFQFDWIETGPGEGPGTWTSVAETGLKPYDNHLRGLRGTPARFRQASAMSIPYRDGSVDAVITDPPYYDMIEYADASDLFHVWLKRILFDIEPDLFGPRASGPKTACRTRTTRSSSGEFMNQAGSVMTRTSTRHPFPRRSPSACASCGRTATWSSCSATPIPTRGSGFSPPCTMPGFVVTSSWPSRTETASTGVASIRVTVTIGCRVAPADREPATVAEVDREVADVIKRSARNWSREGLALGDQMMAAYGPAMEVYGRYATVLQPDGSAAPWNAT